MPQFETRLLAGGIDSDSAPATLQNGDLLSSVNLRFQRQPGQDGGRGNIIKGNTERADVTALLPAVTNTRIGDCVDDATGCIYLFIHNSNGNHLIIECDADAGTSRVVINNAKVTGGLPFTSSMTIACGVGDGNNSTRLLVWADGSEVKYLNLSTNYLGGSAIEQSQLTLISEPGIVPMTVARVTTAGASSTIQFTAIQFTYYFVLADGFTSVLAPLSACAFPTRSSAVLSNVDSGNSITATIPFTQLIPSNWKRVDIVARFVGTDKYYVVKRYDSAIAADVTKVNNHNTGAFQLNILTWTGQTLELLASTYTAKQFDAIPQSVVTLLFGANRLFIANYTEGFNTPVVDPGITTANTTYIPAVPTYTAYTPYVAVIQKADSDDWYFAIFLRIGIKNYLLPKDCSIGHFFYGNNQLNGPNSGTVSNGGIFQVPSQISKENLIELRETGDPDTGSLGNSIVTATKLARENIVKEANSISFETEVGGGSFNWYLMTYDQGSGAFTIKVEDTPAEFGPASQSRAMLPAGNYYYGVQYFGVANRKSGVQMLGTLTMPQYSITSPLLVEKVSFTTPTGVNAAIPDWATNFAITLSKAQNATRVGFFFGGIVKALLKAADGTITYRDRSDLLVVPTGYTVYGIGVPIPTTFKYDYVAGDFVNYYIGAVAGSAKIIGVYNGHIVIEFTNDGTMHTLAAGHNIEFSFDTTAIAADMPGHFAPKTAFVVYSGVADAPQMYEAAIFGQITGAAGSKQFGTFYDSLGHTSAIFGDSHTQVRTSDSGGGVGLAMSPHEDSNSTTLWVTDLGRVAPVDSVGQKDLKNGIRWSNERIPGAAINGYASFDALDAKTTDITAGAITVLVLTTRGAQDGGQMLVLCEHGSFAALIGQQQIAGQDGNNAFTTSANVISNFNALRGGWGCQSPHGVIPFEGRVHFVDAYKKNLIEFNEAGAGNISNFKAARLWNALLSAVSDPTQITLGVDPFAGELLVSLPANSYSKSDLATVTGLKDPLDAATGDAVTYRYNWEGNRWVGAYTSGARMIRVGDEVYGWKDGKLWHEFVGTPGNYYGTATAAALTVPFNKGAMNEPPITKSPISLKVDAYRAPDATWVVVRGATDSVAGVQPYRGREGQWQTGVKKNRVGFGANNNATWNTNGNRGARLKGATIVAVMVWNGSDEVAVSAATLGFDVSSGH